MSRAPLPAGVKRTVLDLLVRSERTAEQIAGRLDVSATAVRQHLATLSGLGLVERRRDEARGGRPAFLYRLTELGRRSYPKRHDLLVGQILETLLDREGRDWTLVLVTEAAHRMAEIDRDRFEGLPPGERWEAVLAWLEEELAWEAEANEGQGGGRRVIVHQCPFQAVSAAHPVVCGTFLTTLLERLTGAGPFVHRPLADGIACCALEPAAAGPSAVLDRSPP